MAALSDYLENKVIDWLLRGQAYTPPSTVYVALFTVADNDAGTGRTEVSGGSYARVAVASSLTNWAGTQSAASTVASTGSSATTTNNNTVTFPAPTAAWGSVVAMGVFDAASGGNELFYTTLAQAKTINSGDAAPSFAPGTLSFVLDN